MAKVNQTEEQVNEKNQSKKVIRRGVSSARGTTRLKFTHELAKPNGLFIGHLDSVDVTTIKIGEDTTGMPSFNGLEIPRVILTFATNEEDVTKRHYVTLTFNAVESNVNTIPGGKEEWKVNSVFDWFKHILNVYLLKGRDFTEEESAALSLNFEDFNEEGDYVCVDPENVIEGWQILFNNFANIMNTGNDNKPIFKTKDGKYIPIWIKLIRYTKNNKKGWQIINNGDLAFPAFVGEGCIEIFKQNTLPSIRFDAVKESILPMNIEKPKDPIMPMAGMAPVNSMMGGVPVGDTMNNMNANFGIAEAAADDMPF